MARFTVYRNPDGKGYLLDLQADINSHFASRVVAPLLPIRDIADYAKTLNPVFEVDGERVVMATQGMAAVPLSILKNPITSLNGKKGRTTFLLRLLQQPLRISSGRSLAADPPGYFRLCESAQRRFRG